ncbi:hypothetical protein PR202_gb29848 [Eleusine coracana subsp. coracana]|uniref:Uncharacterized protein n=1 Tax=Eleusine coracana subsp. coracana TaxID=191504 RepID=A0AAV5FY15_ELECO|nr:hypothetical protein PR202_gb29848 [Eleusine coracana subsp. coracana]
MSRIEDVLHANAVSRDPKRTKSRRRPSLVDLPESLHLDAVATEAAEVVHNNNSVHWQEQDHEDGNGGGSKAKAVPRVPTKKMWHIQKLENVGGGLRSFTLRVGAAQVPVKGGGRPAWRHGWLEAPVTGILAAGTASAALMAGNLKGFSLKGTLGPELGTLSHLRALVLSNNLFSGLIPKEISALALLEILDLSNNNLTGEVPQEIAEMQSLKHL